MILLKKTITEINLEKKYTKKASVIPLESIQKMISFDLKWKYYVLT